MIKDTKTRIAISLPKDLCDDIDTLCGQMGVSRSQFVSMAIGEKVMAYKKAFEISSKILADAGTELIKPMTIS